MKKTLGNYPKLIKEFHPKKNGKLKPKDFLKSSHKKVWWICKNKHEWETRIDHRTSGSNCPYCHGLKASKENNLLKLYPNIAKEWHPTKNGKLKSNQVTKSSNKKVWWRCKKGHEWEAMVGKRTIGRNCPKCFAQSSKPEFRILSELEGIFSQVKSRYKIKNIEIDIYIKDINTGIEYDGAHYHENTIEKDKLKNKKLKKYGVNLIRVRCLPLKKISQNDILVKKNIFNKNDLNSIIRSIYKFSDRENKIKLKKYLHAKNFINEKSYKKYLSYSPSPIPENSLITNTKLKKEWNSLKNQPLKPDFFSHFSGIKVWWKCKKGHEWESRIADRSNGKNCPYCSGQKVSKENNLLKLYPKIAKEWHPSKNGKLKPNEVTKASGKKIWWRCIKGHEWKTGINQRTTHNKTNCPICIKTTKK